MSKGSIAKAGVGVLGIFLLLAALLLLTSGVALAGENPPYWTYLEFSVDDTSGFPLSVTFTNPSATIWHINCEQTHVYVNGKLTALATPRSCTSSVSGGPKASPYTYSLVDRFTTDNFVTTRDVSYKSGTYRWVFDSTVSGVTEYEYQVFTISQVTQQDGGYNIDGSNVQDMIDSVNDQIADQNINKEGFWATLFCPDEQKVLDFRNALANFSDLTPVAIYNQLHDALDPDAEGFTPHNWLGDDPEKKVVHWATLNLGALGNVPIDMDLTSFWSWIEWGRRFAAMGLWVAWLFVVWRKFSSRVS